MVGPWVFIEEVNKGKGKEMITLFREQNCSKVTLYSLVLSRVFDFFEVTVQSRKLYFKKP